MQTRQALPGFALLKQRRAGGEWREGNGLERYQKGEMNRTYLQLGFRE